MPAYDKMRNPCVSGGASVNCTCSDDRVVSHSLDRGDGSYELTWRSQHSVSAATFNRRPCGHIADPKADDLLRAPLSFALAGLVRGGHPHRPGAHSRLPLCPAARLRRPRHEPYQRRVSRPCQAPGWHQAPAPQPLSPPAVNCGPPPEHMHLAGAPRSGRARRWPRPLEPRGQGRRSQRGRSGAPNPGRRTRLNLAAGLPRHLLSSTSLLNPPTSSSDSSTRPGAHPAASSMFVPGSSTTALTTSPLRTAPCPLERTSCPLATRTRATCGAPIGPITMWAPGMTTSMR